MSIHSIEEPGAARAARDRRRWVGLFVMLAGTMLSPIDFFIVVVAMPTIRADLHAGGEAVQLIIAGYSVAYAVLLVTGGRLGDLYGRKRVFLAGVAGFGLASLLCGVAPDVPWLVVARVVQGGFAAILMPQSLALIRATFPEEERPRALGLHAATFGLGAVVGQLMSGVLIAANPAGLGWRSIFLVNLPAVAVILPLAMLLLRENRDPNPRRLERRGVVLLTLALLALIVPLVEGRGHGWPGWCLALLAACPGLLLLFWRHERGVAAKGGDPLVSPGLLAEPGLGRGLAAGLIYNVFASFFLIFAAYQQGALHHDALRTSLAILPLGLGFAAGPWALVRLVAHTRRPATLALLWLAGALLCSALAALAGRAWLMGLALFAIGIGQGLALPSLLRAITDRVDASRAGMAAGLASSALQVGGSLGVAVVGGLFFALVGGVGDPAAATRAFVVGAASIALAAFAAAALVDGEHPARPGPSPQGSRS